MNIREYIDIIEKSLGNIKFSSTYSSGNSEKPYLAKNLTPLRNAINSLTGIDIIQPEIAAIKKTSLFSSYKDEDIFTSLILLNSIDYNLEIPFLFLHCS